MILLLPVEEVEAIMIRLLSVKEVEAAMMSLLSMVDVDTVLRSVEEARCERLSTTIRVELFTRNAQGIYLSQQRLGF